MQNPKLVSARPNTSTQKFLDIAEVKEDTVILNDGTIRSVLLVSSINFALKSEEEQESLIGGYIEFLNSLEHPIQIVIQSRRLNMQAYLEGLLETAKKHENELLRVQTVNYVQYVKELIELGDIMTKKFYIVIPYNSVSDTSKSFFSRLQEAVSPVKAIQLKSKIFEKYKYELDIRTNHIKGSLTSLGLNSVKLDTQGLIELYYIAYNPSTSAIQPMTDVNNLGVEKEF